MISSLNKAISRRGAVTVEAAIVIPLALLILLGGVEFGWLLLRKQQIQGAAHVGARLSALETSTNVLAQNAVDQILATAGVDPADYAVTFNPLDVSTAPAGSLVTVSVDLTYTNITSSTLIPTPSHVLGQATAMKEGVPSP